MWSSTGYAHSADKKVCLFDIKEVMEMAVFKCGSCGATKEGRCKPQKCPGCGKQGSMTKS